MLEFEYRGLRRVISGGQDGADEGGIEAAFDLGMDTGGHAPKGWRVTTGSNPSLTRFGIVEHSDSAYPPRTKLNVKNADGTLLVASNTNSPGSLLTLKYCRQLGKPYHVVKLPWTSLVHEVEMAVGYLVENNIEVLNIAGNAERENRRHGKGPTYHHDLTYEFVHELLSTLDSVGLLIKKQNIANATDS